MFLESEESFHIVHTLYILLILDTDFSYRSALLMIDSFCIRSIIIAAITDCIKETLYLLYFFKL